MNTNNIFKNNVFKVSVDTKTWLKKACVRAIKTFAQTLGSMITVGAAMNEIKWEYAISVATVAMIYSVITSVAGIPEVPEKE